jgi:hypothetical protein
VLACKVAVGVFCSRNHYTAACSQAFRLTRGTNAHRSHCFVTSNNTEETTMKLKTIALATAFALSSTLAFAQAGGNTAGGSSAAGGPAASKTTTGDSMNGSTTGGGAAMKNSTGSGMTTGASTPSAVDSSNQGAPTAGSAEKTGNATSPGGTMKK